MDYTTTMRVRISRKSKRIKILIKRCDTGGYTRSDARDTVKSDMQSIVCILVIPYRRIDIVQQMLIQKAKDFLQSKSVWITRQIEKLKSVHPLVLSDTELKDRTLALVLPRLAHFNQFYNFKYNMVRVKKIETRWGSCSRKGNLNFSHKLALLRPEERDYVVVHELCHLGEFNHGPNFWKLVERAVPNYLEIRKGMKGVVF